MSASPEIATPSAAEIAALRDAFVLRSGAEFPPGMAGKMSIGIGGINACVLSRPWAERS